MKTLIKLIGLVMSVFIFAAVFTACEGNVSDGNVRDNTNEAVDGTSGVMESVDEMARSEMTDLESGVASAVNDIGDSLEAAKTKVADALGMNGGVTEEKVREAVDYIKAHIDDNIETAGRDVREKFVYYAEYLRQAGEKSDSDNEIKMLGTKCGELVSTLMSNSKADVSALRKEIKTSLDKIEADKDKIISDFTGNKK